MKCNNCGKTLIEPWYRAIGWWIMDKILKSLKQEVNDDAFCRGVAEGFKQGLKFTNEQKRYGMDKKIGIEESLQSHTIGKCTNDNQDRSNFPEW